jgi:PHP family Zn ribbon phosphoesterase
VEAMRKQELEIKPGYDGVYGKIILKKKKMSLKEFD